MPHQDLKFGMTFSVFVEQMSYEEETLTNSVTFLQERARRLADRIAGSLLIFRRKMATWSDFFEIDALLIRLKIALHVNALLRTAKSNRIVTDSPKNIHP